MFSLREGELVRGERLSVEFPGRYVGSFQSTLVSVGIIIPIVNDSASYRGICKHKGRLKISADRNLVGLEWLERRKECLATNSASWIIAIARARARAEI